MSLIPNRLGLNQMVEFGWSIESSILRTINVKENIFIWSYFFEIEKLLVSPFDLIKALIKMIWCLKSQTPLTSQIQPSGSDSTGYWIELKLHALIHFEPYFTKIQDRTWLDHPTSSNKRLFDYRLFYEKFKILLLR